MMPAKRHFSQAESARIVALRSDRMSWVDIAADIGNTTRDAVMLHAGRIDASLLVPVNGHTYASYFDGGSDDSRDPLPPGHPDAWGAIVAGTCLDGMEYPL